MRDSGNVMYTPKSRRSRSLERKGTLAAAAKRRRCQEDAQQRDSGLALARLGHSLASNQQRASTIVVPSRLCHGSTIEEPTSTIVRGTTHALP